VSTSRAARSATFTRRRRCGSAPPRATHRDRERRVLGELRRRYRRDRPFGTTLRPTIVDAAAVHELAVVGGTPQVYAARADGTLAITSPCAE
jgi:hypothetical protein